MIVDGHKAWTCKYIKVRLIWNSNVHFSMESPSLNSLLCMTNFKNFSYTFHKLFFVIKYFRFTFYVKTAAPWKRSPSSFPATPSRNWDTVKPPIWKFGMGGRVHTMPILNKISLKCINYSVDWVTIGSHSCRLWVTVFSLFF